MTYSLILSASNGKNMELSKLIEKRISPDSKIEIIDLTSFNFPLFSSRNSNKINSKQKKLISKLVSSNGIIFVSPEYNGGIPPVLSNFVAWATNSLADNWRMAFQDKIAAIATFSGNNGNNLTTSLSIMLSHIGMNIMGRKIIFNYSTGIKESRVDDFCHKFITQISQITG